MRFAVVGAGAIGAYMGARLALAGEDVHLIARRAHLAAMKERGVRVRSPLGDFEAHPPATDNMAEVGPVDYLLLTVKAHSLPQLAPALAPLMGPDTAVVSAQNGIPWWYFQGHGGPLEDTELATVDPGGVVAGAIEHRRVIGCVVYPSTVIVEPGVIEHIEGDRFSIGEPDGSASERCRLLAASLNKAGFTCRIRRDIRQEMWVKLLGNVVFNPLSALTGATLVEIGTHPEAGALAREVMAEADAVAAALGISMPVSIDQRMAGAEKVGYHKTSMLQDVESGRPLELDSVVGAVVELANRLGIPVPHTRTLYACGKLLAHRLAASRAPVDAGPGGLRRP